jgi:DNA topoisomerase-2
MKIKKITIVEHETPKTFYDCTVDIYHNFLTNRRSRLVTHNSSLENAIITMAQKFKNNIPLLEGEGQFGSLRSPQAGASRYIGAKLSENFRYIYKDFELMELKEEDGEFIEPKYFLPIIPTVLLNGTSGIAVGFYSNILNRNPREIITACQNVLNNKKVTEPKPFLNGFVGEFVQDDTNNKKWFVRGVLNIVNSTTVKVSELPPSMTYEKYEDILDKLIDSKDIVSYEDNCKDNVDYTIKFTKNDLQNLDNDKLIKLLKLEESFTEVYTTLDENGKLKIFDSTVDIIKYFVNFRLGYYQKRKDFLINKMNKDLVVLDNKTKFISMILSKKLIINNREKSLIVEDLTKNGFDKINDNYDYLFRMSLSSLTKEVYNKLMEDYNKLKKDIDDMVMVQPNDMYLEELVELKKKYK